MTESHFRAAPAFDLIDLLQEVVFPATTAELVAAAQLAGADTNEIETLRRLPSRGWERLEVVTAAATSGWSPNPSSEAS